MIKKCGEFFLIVSPRQIYLNCSHPEGMYQLATRRHDFIKPQELYKIMDVFGDSIISSDGDMWKRRRKVIAPAFAEKGNKSVWEESLRQAKGLIRFWAGQEGNTREAMIIRDAALRCIQLTLFVISGTGFGVRQVFDSEDIETLGDAKVPGFNTKELPAGHRLAFKAALHTLIEGFVWLMLFPRWLLSKGTRGS